MSALEAGAANVGAQRTDARSTEQLLRRASSRVIIGRAPSGASRGQDAGARAGLRQQRGAATQGVAGEPGFPGNSQFVCNHLIARGVMDAPLQGTLPSVEKSMHDAVLIVGDQQPMWMGD